MAVKFMVVNFMDINFVAMNYYDREIPLKQLKAIRDKAFESFSKMTVLKGRRRIGKTTLGTLAFEGADFVYLFVGRRSESDLCEDFSSEIRRVLGVFVPEGITRFKDIFGLLMSAGETRSFTLFIDEVQEFYQQGGFLGYPGYLGQDKEKNACQPGFQRIHFHSYGKDIQG